MHSAVLKRFVGEFRAESRQLYDGAPVIAGVQSSALVNEGRAVMSHYFGNNSDPSHPPLRMQGLLTYNKQHQRFESSWMGSPTDGISHYHGQLKDEKLVFQQIIDEPNGRVMTVEFIDDDHFNVKLDPSMSNPDVSSLLTFRNSRPAACVIKK